MMAHIVYSIYYIPYTANICAIMHAVPSLLDPRPSTLTHAAQVLQNVSIKLTNGMSQAILKEQAGTLQGTAVRAAFHFAH